MNRDSIFLSYRRDDSPGYVSRLEDELERTFGRGRVFRDATDIPGGTKWKNVIDESLRASAALLLVIGPRWEQIWNERKDDAVNYVALELEQARKLDVPIIPVTLDGTQLSKDIDLGELSWIFENQIHDISDRQGRWAGDFARLVRLLEGMDGIGPARSDAPPPESASKTGIMARLKWIAAGVALAFAALIWLGMSVDNSDTQNQPAVERNTSDTQNHPVVERNTAPVAANQRDIVTPVAQPAPVTTQIKPQPAPSRTQPQPAALVPDIAGVWRGLDDTIYYVEQSADGSFTVESPGYASGSGRFLPNMPRKFSIEMYGVGRGEFAVSADGRKAIGWIIVDGQQEYDTLVRVQ